MSKRFYRFFLKGELSSATSSLALSVFLGLSLYLCLNPKAQGAALSSNNNPAQNIPAQHFFKRPQLSEVAFAPDGKHLAMLMRGENGRINLAVLKVGEMQAKTIATYPSSDVVDFYWLNSQRLLYSLSMNDETERNRVFGPGLYAVNLDGKERLELVNRSANMSSELMPWYTRVIALVSTKSDDFYVRQTPPGKKQHSVFRVNSKTAVMTPVEVPPGSSEWLVDQQGELRYALARAKGFSYHYYKDTQSGKWQQFAQAKNLTADYFEALNFDENGQLLVNAYRQQDKTALYRYDFGTKQFSAQPLLNLSDYDFSGALVFAGKDQQLQGYHYEADTPGSYWINPRLQAIQQQVDKLLYTTVNRIHVPQEGWQDYVLVHSFSDRDPGIWQLYHITEQRFLRIGKPRPEIDPRLMASRQVLQIPTRDGKAMPAILTLPEGRESKHLPLVVLVHGGPFVRGNHWQWEGSSQFLASRGYAVLEPDFRGSRGYGLQYEQAGYRQWGRAMQDDIADATLWASTQGLADPKRVCIAGGSYGGYASLMGLVRHPELYQCAVSWVGVSDISLLFTDEWSDIQHEFKQYDMPLRIGDPEKDVEYLRQVSPAYLTEKITKPVLLAYGAKDKRVPLKHGEVLYEKLKTQNPQSQMVVYPNEAHGWYFQQTQQDFWARVEKFLAQHLQNTATGNEASSK